MPPPLFFRGSLSLGSATTPKKFLVLPVALLLVLLASPATTTTTTTASSTSSMRTTIQRRSSSPSFRCRPPLAMAFATTSTASRTASSSSSSSRRIPQQSPLVPFGGHNRRKMTTTWMGQQEQDFVARQKQVSRGSPTSKRLQQADRQQNEQQQHLRHQQHVFDAMAETFASGATVPNDLVPVYGRLARAILQHHFHPRPAAAPKQDEDDNNNTKAATKATTAATATTTVRILDVACGTGALWPFLAQEAAAAAASNNDNSNIRLDVTGVDVSRTMVERAAAHADRLLERSHSNSSGAAASERQHSFAAVESDILAYRPPPSGGGGGGGGDSNNDEDEAAAAPFDLIVANACFGNFWDPAAVLRHLASLLRPDGTLLVTHPLGSAFVERLHREDPATVPHCLPGSPREWVLDYLLPPPRRPEAEAAAAPPPPLRLVEFVDKPRDNNESDDDDDGNNNTSNQSAAAPFYLAALRKVRARPLDRVLRLRGAVATGYGRGGKQLGFPTANLGPGPFFDRHALARVSTGVYFGWAVLEDGSDNDKKKKTGRNQAHKAVVNVGYSPTFEGQENPEKIVEAHLIFNDDDDDDSTPAQLDPPDFYGETMRLQLIGFLRPEIKFPSFPDLVAQIRQDVQDANEALDYDPYRELAGDDFLAMNAASSSTAWVGTSGGDATASWEFQDIQRALEDSRAK